MSRRPSRDPRGEPKLSPPSPAGYRALGPYARTRLVEKALGQTLALDVPADVFATQRIDDGTLLLLQHLPDGEPRSVLDLGCGYGALGLPVAARFPRARALLIDRDLLAVAAAAHNAAALGLGNVTVRPGLGYRGLGPHRDPDRDPRSGPDRGPGTGPRSGPDEAFDWVLCNVPARIGPKGVRYLIEGGRALGDLRIVVIRDLQPQVDAVEGVRRVALGTRHAIYAADARRGPMPDDAAVYARDQTGFLGLTLDRPHDASEDPTHAARLQVLADALPRAAPASVLCFRAGYGALPLFAGRRWPGARVVAQDRDLLDTEFLRRNARALGLPVEVREALYPGQGEFALVLGELSPSAGAAVAARELQETLALLAPGGQALVLLSEKMEREWLPQAIPRGAQAAILLRREGASVLRISRSRGSG